MQVLKQICCDQAVYCLSTADLTDEGWEIKKKQEFIRGVKQFAKFEKLATWTLHAGFTPLRITVGSLHAAGYQTWHCLVSSLLFLSVSLDAALCICLFSCVQPS